jgi:hypothetical protein
VRVDALRKKPEVSDPIRNTEDTGPTIPATYCTGSQPRSRQVAESASTVRTRASSEPRSGRIVYSAAAHLQIEVTARPNNLTSNTRPAG